MAKKKAATKQPAEEKSEVDESQATDRDVLLGDDQHKGTTMLVDLITLHYVMNSKKRDKKSLDALAARLTSLMIQGRQVEVSDHKDVPKPFMKAPGRFFEKKNGGWALLTTEAQAKTQVSKLIQATFKKLEEEEASQPEDVAATVEKFHNEEPAIKDIPSDKAPRPWDVLFMAVDYPEEERVPYEHHSGNKHLLFLASQQIASESNDSLKRIDAAFKIATLDVEVAEGTELKQKNPRFVVQSWEENQNKWQTMDRTDLAEFCCMFVFEVWLEKKIHGVGGVLATQVAASLIAEQAKPSDVPVDAPTEHDVLWGRGGMTNGHVGNRRFRDIIALHRPDYIRATKMDKPNVARRIVRAIRNGTPPGRFLRKGDDGKWYDVGDRAASEKTSQGLRERSNAEKRQRSAMREALKIRREDLAEGEEGPATKKKRGAGAAAIGEIPLFLMKATAKGTKAAKKAKKMANENKEPLPPNAVDDEGHILVTDHDILCGRGGLANHHEGNKRFRLIVAERRPDYVKAPKIQKPAVARAIVRAIRSSDPPGRFLKKDNKTGLWTDIGDKKAAEKTSQALREKLDEEKDGKTTAVKPKASETSKNGKSDEKKDETKKTEETEATTSIEV